jgi:putative Holliday junction resolvase
MGRVLGVDWGDRWIGLALSDPGGSIAWPLDVLDGADVFWQAIDGLIAGQGIERIVLGIPVNMDGTAGPRARQALALREEIERRTGRPVEAWDERLTTVEAEAWLRRAGLSTRERRDRVDKLAAQILLQSYLDARKSREERGAT